MPNRIGLPQLSGDFFLTDGGLETTLIFQDGLDLVDFAAFDLLSRPEGAEALERYFRSYVSIAERFDAGLILETATWRASTDWASRLGYTRAQLAAANRACVRLLYDIRRERAPLGTKIVVSGCIGPRGDGYVPGALMTVAEAEAYHTEQVETFCLAGVDLVTGVTMNYPEEALGIVRSARRARVPVVISFTVETDGMLPMGVTLRSAIEEVDEATAGYPAYYMINCAHPTHFEDVLRGGGAWVDRIRGVRANASCRSHAELNEATELNMGDPAELGRQYAELRRMLPRLNVLGGCCGTDTRHIEAIAEACAPAFAAGLAG